jgi:hypothetical protein
MTDEKGQRNVTLLGRWEAWRLESPKKIKRIQMAETLNSEVGSRVAEYKKAQIPLEPSSLPASRLPSLPAFLPLRPTPWVLSYSRHPRTCVEVDK